MKINFFGHELTRQDLSKWERWILLIWDEEYKEWDYWTAYSKKEQAEHAVKNCEKKGCKVMLLNANVVKK